MLSWPHYVNSTLTLSGLAQLDLSEQFDFSRRIRLAQCRSSLTAKRALMAVVFSGTRKRQKRRLLKDEQGHSPFCATEHATFVQGGCGKGTEIETLKLERMPKPHQIQWIRMTKFQTTPNDNHDPFQAFDLNGRIVPYGFMGQYFSRCHVTRVKAGKIA